MAEKSTASAPGDGVKGALQDALSALGDRAMHTVQDKVSGLTDTLSDMADGEGLAGKAAAEGAEEAAEGGSPVKGAVKGGLSAAKDKVKEALPGGGGGRNQKPEATKAMNFVESLDVGVPVRVAYNQWTQYQDWPEFMKKVEHAEQDPDEPTVNMKAQVFLSHRSWEATIQDQIPDQRILWRSTGEKGHVDGCVTFHEIGPRLTRILVTLEYYPQGFFERVGNLWRAPGRRARLELKHFRRHVMMNTILSTEDLEGWRGEIEDGEVIRTHEEGQEDDQNADQEPAEDEDEQSPDDADGQEEADPAEDETEESDDDEPDQNEDPDGDEEAEEDQ